MTTRHAHAARSTTLAAPPLHTVGRAVVTEGAAPLTLDARIVPWGVPARVTDDGRTFYTETWSPGSLVPDDRVFTYSGHVPAGGGPGRLNADREVIGRAVPTSYRTERDGLYATLQLADTPEGRRVHALAVVLGEVDVSLEAAVPFGASGTVARTAAEPCALTGVAIVLPPGNGAYRGAVATAGRADAAPVDDDPDPDGDDPDDDDAGDAVPAPSAGRAAVAELVRAEVARYQTAGRRPAAPRLPIARYQSFDELMNVARSGSRADVAEAQAAFVGAYRAHVARARLHTAGRALVDQVTADNPGLMPPSWLTEVFGIIDEGRPGIMAFGGPRSPGDTGMDVYWPYYDGDLSAIVAEQVGEKTAIHSVKVSFKRGQATLDTFAGGSDVAYQLQRRSSPAYMGLYDRILQLAYGVTTEAAFDAILLAGAGVPLTYDLGTDDDGSAARAILFQGSAAVKRATGRPATAALAAPDVYAALGGASWLQPAAYGTANVAGTAQASTLSISVSGLTITEAPGLADGNLIMGNDSSAAWFEDGPFLVTAEDVEKLGTNVAIWGMGQGGLFLPNGVVKITVTVPPPVAGRGASSGPAKAK
jgi:hypothetical protein